MYIYIYIYQLAPTGQWTTMDNHGQPYPTILLDLHWAFEVLGIYNNRQKSK